MSESYKEHVHLEQQTAFVNHPLQEGGGVSAFSRNSHLQYVDAQQQVEQTLLD